MNISEAEREAMETVRADCTESELVVTLANGQKIVTALWWYPRLFRSTPEQRERYELSPFGVHWPDIDEDLSIEGMLKGARAPGAVEPAPADAALSR